MKSLCVPLLLAVALASSSLLAEAGKGVPFLPGSLQAALERAKAEKKNVLVDVYAEWCGPCKKQRAEVFQTADGLALTQSLIAWKVDFDDEGSRHLMESWNILSLPTVLFLRPDGTEIDRIEGYDDKASFLKDAEARGQGLDPLPELQKQYARAKTEGERLPLLVKISRRRLVRGEHEVGVAGLEEAALLDSDGKLGAAEDALFLLGRFLSRVQRDFSKGRHVWRELYFRFPEGKYAATAMWWYAGAVHELGHAKLGFDLMESHAARYPKSPLGLDLMLSFAESKKVESARALAAYDKRKASLSAKDRAALDETAKKLR